MYVARRSRINEIGTSCSCGELFAVSTYARMMEEMNEMRESSVSSVYHTVDMRCVRSGEERPRDAGIWRRSPSIPRFPPARSAHVLATRQGAPLRGRAWHTSRILGRSRQPQWWQSMRAPGVRLSAATIRPRRRPSANAEPELSAAMAPSPSSIWTGCCAHVGPHACMMYRVSCVTGMRYSVSCAW